jgi:hypothetical protein
MRRERGLAVPCSWRKTSLSMRRKLTVESSSAGRLRKRGRAEVHAAKVCLQWGQIAR